ncbi:MAG: DUF4340 domain-containing protein [Planctomycetota bacterium]
MTGKLTWLMLLVMALFAGIWYWSKPSDYSPKTETPAAIAALTKFEPGKVQELTLAKGANAVTLKRVPDGWQVVSAWNYPATAVHIDEFLKSIRQIRDPEVRGQEQLKHASFEIDKEQAWRIELKGDGPGFPVTFLVGKSNYQEQRCYVRTPDSNIVYAVKPDLVYAGRLYKGQELSDAWVDKQIYKQPEDTEIEQVKARTETGEIALVAKPRPAPEPAKVEGDGGAPTTEPTEPKPDTPPAPPPPREYAVKAPEEFEPDQNVVRGWVSRFKNISAAGAVDPAKLVDYGLEPPQRTVEFTLTNGDRVVLEVGGKEVKPAAADGETPSASASTQDRYYVRKQGDSRVFLINSYLRDGFFKTTDELKQKPKDPPPVTAPSADGAASPPVPSSVQPPVETQLDPVPPAPIEEPKPIPPPTPVGGGG